MYVSFIIYKQVKGTIEVTGFRYSQKIQNRYTKSVHGHTGKYIPNFKSLACSLFAVETNAPFENFLYHDFKVLCVLYSQE